MKQKDYYTLLGVHKRSSKEEIKQSYRKLAKKYHPDANPGSPEIEEVFKDLTVAYDILMDKEKKKKYDRQVARYGYGAPPKGVKKEVKYGVKNTDVASELFSTMMGITKDAKEVFKNKAENIKVIMNSKKEAKKGDNVEATIDITLEEGFFGASKKLVLKTISGKTNTYTVQVPRGIRDGEKIRLAALGKPGKNGGKNGDLIITVNMKEHQNLKLDGVDVHTTIDVSFAQAAIGDKVFLKIFGEQIEVNIPARIRENERIVIPKQGYINGENVRGNLVLHINLKRPEEISERERKIYEQLLRVEKQKLRDKTHTANKTAHK